jgi:protoheme IX farnesyltransferase
VSVAVARPDARRIALAYLELSKPRIVMLVLLTGIPALLLAAGGGPRPGLLVGAVLGTALAAASAAAFNHYFDRDLDGLMSRTKSRPLPSGTLPPAAALAFACELAALTWLVLVTLTNLLAAVIGALSIVYYAGLYTVWLKRSTPQNIVIGGGAGATAPLIAWAAVTGTIGLPAVLLAAIVFFWTPPHFWALALFRRDDYARAGIPMLPVTHGEDETRRQITLYTLCLVAVTLAPVAIGVAGPIYGIPAAILGGTFAWLAWRLMVTADLGRAVRLFHFSIAYLFVLFVFLGIDAAVGGARRGPLGARAAAVPPAAVETALPAESAPLEMRFTAHAAGDLPVRVEPLTADLFVRRGSPAQVDYRFTNTGDRPVEFQAVHRITPADYDSLFHKKLCFCFTRQRLAAGESQVLPVRFEVDARLPRAVRTLALDYALFELAPVDSPSAGR